MQGRPRLFRLVLSSAIGIVVALGVLASASAIDTTIHYGTNSTGSYGGHGTADRGAPDSVCETVLAPGHVDITNYGFNIPSNATNIILYAVARIGYTDGIQIQSELILGGVATGRKSGLTFSGNVPVACGGFEQTDVYSNPGTPAQINSSGLGVRFYNLSGATMLVDSIGIVISYEVPPTNCAPLPNVGAGYNFTSACAAHNACYDAANATPSQLFQREAERGACDTAFYNAMVASCNGNSNQPDVAAAPNGNSWALYLGCLTRATTYYSSSVAVGWLVFYDLIAPWPAFQPS